MCVYPARGTWFVCCDQTGFPSNHAQHGNFRISVRNCPCELCRPRLCAGYAGQWQLVLVQVTLVATHTLGYFMLAKQRIFCFFVMVENDLFPISFNVASFAFCTEFSLVNFVIVFLMT